MFRFNSNWIIWQFENKRSVTKQLQFLPLIPLRWKVSHLVGASDASEVLKCVLLLSAAAGESVCIIFQRASCQLSVAPPSAAGGRLRAPPPFSASGQPSARQQRATSSSHRHRGRRLQILLRQPVCRQQRRCRWHHTEFTSLYKHKTTISIIINEVWFGYEGAFLMLLSYEAPSWRRLAWYQVGVEVTLNWTIVVFCGLIFTGNAQTLHWFNGQSQGTLMEPHRVVCLGGSDPSQPCSTWEEILEKLNLNNTI